jgi:hypothetical protein
VGSGQLFEIVIFPRAHFRDALPALQQFWDIF